MTQAGATEDGTIFICSAACHIPEPKLIHSHQQTTTTVAFESGHEEMVVETHPMAGQFYPAFAVIIRIRA